MESATKSSVERSAGCVRWLRCARDHTDIEPSNAAVQTRSAFLNVSGGGDADNAEDDDKEYDEHDDDEMMASDETEAVCASESITASCETAAVAVEYGDDNDDGNNDSGET